ncbi:MAG: ribosome recycling factor, partial [Lactiplantibacillus plantarum]|nr:ribosome recycling factor [Lactiplantibacillus plantarum]
MIMADQIIDTAQAKMTKAEEALKRELGTIRAGRANASILNRV